MTAAVIDLNGDREFSLIPADRAMQKLLDSGCGIDLGNGWKHFTVDMCCVQFAVTALRHPSGWVIRDMVAETST